MPVSNRFSIGVDIRVLVLGKRTGVEEYVLNLLPRMIAKHPEAEFKLFYNGLRKQKLDFPWLHLPNVKMCEYSIPNRFALFPLNAFAGFPKLDKLIGGCDVFWSPHIFCAAISPNVRHAVTVHDLAFERHPEFFSKGKLWWHKYLMRPRKMLKKSAHIIASSESTKSDIGHIYCIPPEKISAVPLGVGTDFHPIERKEPALEKIRSKYGLPARFVLFFGTIEPRKNIAGLIKAFEMLKQGTGGDFHDLNLVIAGARGWMYEEVFRAARKSPFAGAIRFAGFVDEEDKPALYNLADIFVYPSFFEGFGFPPLEAMACGVPVITSNRSSLPEVTGDAALLIDPFRPAEISEAMRVTLTDFRTREDFVRRGLEKAKEFSWDLCAERTFSILVK
jgi:glycosyltransferase involved in cell wall biosynthesis